MNYGNLIYLKNKTRILRVFNWYNFSFLIETFFFPAKLYWNFEKLTLIFIANNNGIIKAKLFTLYTHTVQV